MKFLFVFLISSLVYAQQPEAFFHKTYYEARSEFKLAVSLSNMGELSKFTIPSKVDSDLSTDVYYLKKQGATKLLVMSSGVHGTEAFAGSAALVYFLKNYVNKYKNLSVLLIHSLNPYGQKYQRRYTENNVDLNRNFSAGSGIYKLKNQGYSKLSEVLNPKGQLDSDGYYGTAYKLIKQLVLGASMADLRQASVGGQYQESQGISYGGNQQEPITKMMANFLPQILNDYEHILHLDFHTGLGEDGVMHLLKGDNQNEKSLTMMRAIFPKNEKRFKVTADDDKGFYTTSGDIISFMNELSPKQNILSMAVEFGTMGTGTLQQIKTLDSLIKENQGYQFGYQSEELKIKIKKNLTDIFNPINKKWREGIYTNTKFLFDDAIKRFIEY